MTTVNIDPNACTTSTATATSLLSLIASVPSNIHNKISRTLSSLHSPQRPFYKNKTIQMTTATLALLIAWNYYTGKHHQHHRRHHHNHEHNDHPTTNTNDTVIPTDQKQHAPNVTTSNNAGTALLNAQPSASMGVVDASHMASSIGASSITSTATASSSLAVVPAATALNTTTHPAVALVAAQFSSPMPSSSRSRKSRRPGVNAEFYRNLVKLLKIAIPHWKTKEVMLLVLHSVFLVARTYLSVLVARLDGIIVRDLIAGKGREFIKGLGYWFLISVPATYTNSMIKFLQSKLSIAFRTRLTKHAHQLYLDNESATYYKVMTLDNRIQSPDQLITADIATFCESLSSLYSNLAKPMLDLVIFTYQLTGTVGFKGIAGLMTAYALTAHLLRRITPEFGKLAAKEAKLEGDFRLAHSRLITNSEEIAFYQGAGTELRILNTRFDALLFHVNRILKERILFHMMEDFILKYSWSAWGLLISAVPVFLPQWIGNPIESPTEAGGAGTSRRTQGFITNKRLMISLADAGSRIMSSYKEVVELSGMTARVAAMFSVFDDVAQGKYHPPEVKRASPYSIKDIRGRLILVEEGNIRFDAVPIVTPIGEELVKPMTFEIDFGEHTMITGPNGVGKSSILRIISGLWPVFRGSVERPDTFEIIFIPQKAYLSTGTLRDQIIYPHSHADMLRAGRNDDELFNILNIVNLAFIIERDGGWDAKKEWKDVFSGGEKQRIGMARVFYHRPRFAILDECTSAVSSDIEGLMYNYAKQMDISLVTVSHRPSLFKYHDCFLKLGVEGSWAVTKHADMTQETMSFENRKVALEKWLHDLPSVRRRLDEVNKQLGVATTGTSGGPSQRRRLIVGSGKALPPSSSSGAGSSSSGPPGGLASGSTSSSSGAVGRNLDGGSSASTTRTVMTPQAAAAASVAAHRKSAWARQKRAGSVSSTSSRARKPSASTAGGGTTEGSRMTSPNDQSSRALSPFWEPHNS